MDKMTNLTPHEIIIRTADGQITLPPSGRVARVSTSHQEVGNYSFYEDFLDQEVPVVRPLRGRVEGLENGPVIVSGMVLDALRAEGCERRNVFAPDTGPTAVRQNGQIVAVTRLLVL